MNTTPVVMSEFAKTIMEQKYSHTLPSGEKETWENIAYRVSKHVMKAVDAPKELTERIRKLIQRRAFIPGGRYLYATGRAYHQVQNCLLFKAQDSREGWSTLMQKSTMGLMTGAGIGVDYSEIRAEGKLIRKTGGTATGPLAIMQMVNEAGRGIMQGGNRRCLPEGSLIHTKNGLISIENIEIDQEVITSDGYHKVTGKVDTGIQELIIIQTQNGIIKCTPNHRVAVVESVFGEYSWKEASKLLAGDRLYFLNESVLGDVQQLPIDERVPSLHSYTLQNITIPELDGELAWLIGLIHGDGCVYLKDDTKDGPGKRHGRVHIACSNDYPDIIDRAVEQLSRFGVRVTISDGDGDLKVVKCHSVQLAAYFQKYIKTPNTTIEIPKFIRQGTIDVRSGYIAGVMDADGCSRNRPVVVASSIYPEFLEQLQRVCSSLGFATRIKRTRPARGNWKALYNLGVSSKKQLTIFRGVLQKYGHKIDFDIPQGSQFSYSLPGEITNKSKLFKFRENGINISIERIEQEIGPQKFTPVAVLGIEVGESCQTWDIEVKGKEEFVTNGYLVHNSAIWAGLSWRHADILKFICLKDWSEGVKKLKEEDFNFPATMDGTNISVLLDDLFFKAYDDEKHDLHNHARSVYWMVVEHMLKTGEPGFSINTGKNSKETLRNACTELVSEDTDDICNLGSINLSKINSLEEMKEAVELGTAFLLAGTVYSDVPYADVDKVREKNRRLGLGLMGIHEWLLTHNKPYGPDPELEEYLKIYATSTEVAHKYAEEWDLSKPVKTRAIAPNGTIGICAETTTGMEPIFCVAYKRRYHKGSDLIAYQYVIDPTARRLIDRGVDPEQIEDAYMLAETVERRVEFQAWLQKFVDHSISSTINLPEWGSEHNNSKTVQSFGNMLIKYLPELRGITCYPDGARGGQPLTPVKYTTASKHVGEVFYETEDVCSITKAGSCG